jgi:hypothetical protein
MGIVRQDHEIGQLAGGDRALDMLFM